MKLKLYANLGKFEVFYDMDAHKYYGIDNKGYQSQGFMLASDCIEHMDRRA